MPKQQKETAVRQQAMLRFSQRGYVLFRYVVGLFFTRDGYPVKLGVPGVSDLIGYRLHTVTAEDVGRTLPVFAVVEVKQGRHGLEEEQKRFLQVVHDAGGEAWVTRDEEDRRWVEVCAERGAGGQTRAMVGAREGKLTRERNSKL